MTIARRALTAAAVCMLVTPALARAQQDSGKAVKVVTPSLDFSGLIFGSFSYRTDSAAKAGAGGKNPNRFNLDPVILTCRRPLGAPPRARAGTDAPGVRTLARPGARERDRGADRTGGF